MGLSISMLSKLSIRGGVVSGGITGSPPFFMPYFIRIVPEPTWKVVKLILNLGRDFLVFIDEMHKFLHLNEKTYAFD